MTLLLQALLSAFVPVGVEGAKQLITTKLGGVKPTTVAEQIQLDDQEIKRLNAVAALDTPGGTPSQWVIDLRASSRYIAAIVVIVAGLGTLYAPNTNPATIALALDAISVVFGFLFGTRLITNVKK